MTKKKGKVEVSKSRKIPVFMNIKTDFGFKKIFGNKVLLIAFLNAILDKDIVEVEYLPAEQLGYIKENRRAVYDVYCTTATGERFIVEMQASPQVHFADRIVFYTVRGLVLCIARHVLCSEQSPASVASPQSLKT
jgi:hypothetical protein